MLKQEVATLFNTLVRHGVKPPCDIHDKAAREGLVGEFFEKYQNLKDAEVHELVERVPLLGRWPTFADVDDIIASYRRDQIAKQFSGKRQGAAKRDQEVEAALGHKPPLGETWTLAMAKKTAKRHFPDADKAFVEENQALLAAQCEKDYICDTCYGTSIHECKTGGHQPFLMIEPHSGVLLDCVDCERCSKVIIPVKDDRQGGQNNGR